MKFLRSLLVLLALAAFFAAVSALFNWMQRPL